MTATPTIWCLVPIPSPSETELETITESFGTVVCYPAALISKFPYMG